MPPRSVGLFIMKVKTYTLKIKNLVIDNDDYHVIPILSVTSDKDTNFEDLLKGITRDLDFTFRWEGNYLAGIDELDLIAEKLFQTKEFGIIYFVNKSELTKPSNLIEVKRGDYIELVYVEKNWEKRG